MSKILWISHTSLSIGETFIANTLQLLKDSKVPRFVGRLS